ncbi:hypothetical protein BHS09_07385 [Myxococcus xanthus]|uniref:DUF6444 domain-containing protein n=1 Tax=Myxococcus xanthus TaxID=34 RepID=A0AAE6KR23_MYXXA|nr:hypothetical protein BHS09_07385 [Myxococcus xanthus]QDE74121.1 hypothetical protein BHS08_07390 [Myxococcus xanthus]QDF03021.1 hypothetical protein BHS04_07290 [Myxococcus xanthus]
MAEVDPKDARIAELERQVEELTRLVRELREQLRRNSGNSNRPPSSDTLGQRTERRRQCGSGKKRGGQPGHKGLTRALVAEEKVSEFKHLFPSECENCWVPLSRDGGTRGLTKKCSSRLVSVPFGVTTERSRASANTLLACGR